MRESSTAAMLAQTDSGAALVSLLPILAAVVVIAAILLFALAMVRRWLREDSATPRDFSLGDLRRMRDEGKLSQEELDRAKQVLVGRVQTRLANDQTSAAPRMDADVKA